MDKCPGCGGPVSFLLGDADGVRVFYVCPDARCTFGKLTLEEVALAEKFN